MNVGKIFIIIGAILTLVSTFFLSLFSINVFFPVFWLESGVNQANGLSFFLHFPELFTEAGALATFYGIDILFIYISVIIFTLWAISGFIQLIGVRFRAAAIVGSILPLYVGIVIIVSTFIYLPGFLRTYQTLLLDSSLIDGIIPLGIPIGGLSIGPNPLSLGTYLLVSGGVLGFIGGIVGVK